MRPREPSVSTSWRRSATRRSRSTRRAVAPDDLLTLIYTSGTTGPSKGVELTHRSMLAQIAGLAAVLPVTAADRSLSYLPLAHVADRSFSHYNPMVFGYRVTSVPDLAGLFPAVLEVAPTVWAAVPRIWEKQKAALEAGFAGEPDEQRRAGIAWALDVGLRKVRAEQAAIAGTGPGPGEALLAEYDKADSAVWSAVRARLGLHQVRWSCSGAAPTSLDVLEFFGAIGLPIQELWGMSELSCCGTINPERTKLGTVGPAVPGLELRRAADGELLCRGAQVMRGYRGEPGLTAEALDPDGWLHTGDIAEIDADGYVTIVDRKKELIINAAGKNMSPANIEAAVKGASPLIGQVVVIGDRRPYNVALVVLDPDAGAAFAAQHGIPDASVAVLAAADGVRAAMEAAVDRANERLSRVEQVKAFTILGVDWLPAGDELTPTMKLRRRPIAEKYASQIEDLYAATTAVR